MWCLWPVAPPQCRPGSVFRPDMCALPEMMRGFASCVCSKIFTRCSGYVALHCSRACQHGLSVAVCHTLLHVQHPTCMVTCAWNEPITAACVFNCPKRAVRPMLGTSSALISSHSTHLAYSDDVMKPASRSVARCCRRCRRCSKACCARLSCVSPSIGLWAAEQRL